MIRMTIEINEVPIGGNEFGTGVSVSSIIDGKNLPPESEGATFVGICLAINEYMRSRGARDFDCLKLGAMTDDAERANERQAKEERSDD